MLTTLPPPPHTEHLTVEEDIGCVGLLELGEGKALNHMIMSCPQGSVPLVLIPVSHVGVWARSPSLVLSLTISSGSSSHHASRRSIE